MGVYSRVVFPWLCDLALDRPQVAALRRQLLKDAHGEILEIGFGTGLNLPHYPSDVRVITAVDTNPATRRRARKRIEQTGITVDERCLSGEELGFVDATFDCVVSAFTLCSIECVDAALAEMYRVLKPGGRLLFLEHGQSPDPRTQKWQRRLNWLERRLAGNCHLDRNIRELVVAQPFRSLELDELDLERTPRTHGHIYRGAAIK